MSGRIIFTTGQPSGIWLATLLALASAAQAGSAYLPLTGPPPLRFEVAFIRPAALLPVVATPTIAEKIEEKKPAGTTPAATNLSEKTSAPEELLHSGSETNPPPTAAFEVPTANSFAAHSLADNLLVITPQMLSEYFKPLGGSTNAGGVSVILPLPVGFTPPTEKNPPSSRATYKVQ